MYYKPSFNYPSGNFLHVMCICCMQLSCMFKETCMSQYCEYSVVCMSHVTCIENIQNPCILHAHNMQTCMENVPNSCMLYAKNMPVTCRDLGHISTRVHYLFKHCYSVVHNKFQVVTTLLFQIVQPGHNSVNSL